MWSSGLGIGSWIFVISDVSESCVYWFALLVMWGFAGLMIFRRGDVFQEGMLTWCSHPDGHWRWWGTSDSININAAKRAVVVRCVWRSNTRMLLSLHLHPSVWRFAWRSPQWLWLRSDTRPAQWRAMCRAVHTHAVMAPVDQA